MYKRQTFTCPDPAPGDTDVNTFSVATHPASETVTASVEWIKIERGNHATDWTPAPEDINTQTSLTVLDVYKRQAIDSLIHSEERAKEQMEESVSAYKIAKQELAEINNELDIHKSRIAELQSKGTLTYAEQKELEKLQQITKELEIQKKLKEYEEKGTQKAAMDDTVKAYKKEYSQPLTEESLEEYRKGAAEPGAPLATYFSESSDLAAKIAAYEQLIKLQKDLENTNPEQAQRIGKNAADVEASIWKLSLIHI